MSNENKNTSQNQGLGSGNIEVDFDFNELEQVSKIFFEESKGLLEDLDSLLLQIEESPDDSELMAELFRKVHTLKGSVGPVPGGNFMGSLAHEFEALIEKFRVKSQPVNKSAMDLFLRSAWLLKALAENLREGRETHADEQSEVIETIGKLASFQMPRPEDSQVDGRKKADKSKKKRKHKDDEDGVWLSKDQLAELLNVGSEFVVLRNYHMMMNQAVNFRHEPELFEKRQTEFAQNLNKLTDLLQENIVRIQKVSVHSAFDGLNALVRQVTSELQKEVVVHTIGFDLPIDRNLASELYQVLVHLIRNSLDHGIESPHERTESGKDKEGHLTISFDERNGIIYFKVSDDGRGLNREKILSRAISKGIISQEKAQTMSEDEILQLIMRPGFSTADRVSTISGRGIGMDVVKDTIESYGGKIVLKSKPGQGMEISTQFPVPRNIMVEKVLLCAWSDFQIAVPLSNVARIISCRELQLTEVDGLRFCQFDGTTVPLLNYNEICSMQSDLNQNLLERTAIFIRTREGALALIVDGVSRQADLVIRSFNKLVKSVRGFKGSSVLADDKVTYIVDPPQLIQMVQTGSRGDESNRGAA